MFRKEINGKTNTKGANVLVFLFIIWSVFILMLILIFSKLKVEIENLKLSTHAPRLINKDYKATVKLFILGIIPIIKIKITKERLEKLKFKEKIQRLESKVIENENEFDKKTFRKIILVSKKINIDVERINLNIEIGTENAGVTALVVSSLSALISIYLSKKIKKINSQKFEVVPKYIGQNLINILFCGIFEVKMFHIINIIYILMKKEGEDKNERTSNRGTYDYSYE